MDELKEMVGYLLGSSRHGLGRFELARLNRVADLRKQMQRDLEELVEQMARANLARMLLDHGEELIAGADAIATGQQRFDFPTSGIGTALSPSAPNPLSIAASSRPEERPGGWRRRGAVGIRSDRQGALSGRTTRLTDLTHENSARGHGDRAA
jgi:hypothetical protein